MLLSRDGALTALDRRTGRERAVAGSGSALPGAVNRGGRSIVFTSTADDPVPDDTHGALDVFIDHRHRPPSPTGLTDRRPASPQGEQLLYASTRIALATALVAAAVALTGTPTSAAPRVPATDRITVSATGEQGTDHAAGPYLSADGRYAAFASYAPNLVPGDTNGVEDAFVRDLRTGRLERVSVATDGTQADRGTKPVALSADGRYVVLVSSADTLTAWPEPKEDWAQDVYVHDRVTRRTERISTTPTGASSYAHGSAAISDNGRYVAFNARPKQMESGESVILPTVYLTDRRTGAVERITNRNHPELGSYHLDMSADGRHVVYEQNPPRGGAGAMVVHDRRTGAEEQVVVTPQGTPSESYGLDPSISADGRYVAFTYRGDDLLPDGSAGNTETYVRDLRTDTTRGVVHDGIGGPAVIAGPEISRDGRYVAYGFRAPQGQDNIHVRDLRTGASSLASASVTGGPVTDEDVYATSFGGAGGKLLGLGSGSGQLVTGDTNGVSDGFVRHLR
ncbi:TolB family protein [Streptomyces sp. NPDC093568]|uniref:TolB family protein n=1 Tax=Streptomyces sp. NPDC093568 TaxID=3366041 RepID=UPI00380CA55C